ncbi:hypothetical protein DESPIG_01115 [Desulfovibrio piger ATCC 29098]|uniref:Uncharacterized protein n=1 Tax=Desulfovibrio piger ATCC 29098 TaxID=411464 RepID=B6WSR3_9BACT|nr:hypothetical protein DESPIG_01115 [Desulfovibrio piger ATCC 29098]
MAADNFPSYEHLSVAKLAVPATFFGRVKAVGPCLLQQFPALLPIGAQIFIDVLTAICHFFKK